MHSLRASAMFSVVVLVTLALLGFIGLMLVGALLGLNPAVSAMGHFSSLSHRVHDLTYSVLFGVSALGMLAQLRAPSRNVAGQLMALIPWVSFVLAFAFGNILFDLLRPPFVPIFGGLALLAIVLHPSEGDIFRSFSVSRVSRVMLGLVIIAAVPLLAFAASNIGLQRTVPDDHAAQGHYGYMAAFSFTVIGMGLLASLRPAGWWLPAWVAGLLAALLGFVSVMLPGVRSSLGLLWALGAMAWGIVFVAAGQLVRRTSPAAYAGNDTSVGLDRGGTTKTPGWVTMLGVVAVVLVLLFVFLHVTGGVPGPGGHRPP